MNETMHRMSSQEERYQATLNQLHSDISELKSSTQRLNQENLTLRAQVDLFLSVTLEAIY